MRPQDWLTPPANLWKEMLFGKWDNLHGQNFSHTLVNEAWKSALKSSNKSNILENWEKSPKLCYETINKKVISDSFLRAVAVHATPDGLS